MGVGFDDVASDLAIPLNPFQSFQEQAYHLLNISDFGLKIWRDWVLFNGYFC